MQALPAGTAGEYTLDLAEEPLRDASGKPLSQAARKRKVSLTTLVKDIKRRMSVSVRKQPATNQDPGPEAPTLELGQYLVPTKAGLHQCRLCSQSCFGTTYCFPRLLEAEHIARVRR